MSKRKVTLKLTTQKDLMVFESSARTYGELKKEITSVKWDGMRVVERSTKNTLQHEEAVLPATDFVLFLVPEKVKSGAGKSIDVDTANYNELRSHISFLNKMKNAKLSMNGKVDDLRKALKKYLKKQETVNVEKKAAPANVETSANVDAVVDAIEEGRAKINEAIDAIIELAKSNPESIGDTTEYAFKTSMEELENEISGIKNNLKL